MYANKILLTCLFAFILFSCEDLERENTFDFKNSIKYNIQYNFEVSFQLTVYENNDTIYLVDINKTEVKIKSEQKKINQIKNLIVNHFQSSNLNKDSSKMSDSEGFLFMSINNKNNNIISNQTELTIEFQNNIINIYQPLKNKNKLIFNP